MKECMTLILLLPMTILGYCIYPYEQVGTSCLSFQTIGEVTHAEARQMCHTIENGELAVVFTPTQHKAIVDYIHSQGLAGRSFWIDGTDEAAECVWVTSNGLSLPMGTPFWGAGDGHRQPDNGGGTQHCVNLYGPFNYYMDDADCTTRKNLICETPVLNQNPNETLYIEKAIDCPPYYVDIGGKCLSFMTWVDETWEPARESCVGWQGELAAINDPEQLRALYLYLHNAGLADHSFWLGGTDSAQEGSWVWLDGSPVPIGTPFWGLDENDGVVQEPQGSTKENCVAVIGSGEFYFRDLECGNRIANPLCQYTGQ